MICLQTPTLAHAVVWMALAATGPERAERLAYFIMDADSKVSTLSGIAKALATTTS